MKKQEINTDKKSVERAGSFLSRVSNKFNEAKDHFESYNYSESISASQECIELSLKAVFLLLGEKYKKRHEFKEKEFKKILKKIPEELKYIDFTKLYLYSKFWDSFYTVAKYGFEELRVGADKLFEREEAYLALKHAEKCKNAADQLENHIHKRGLAERIQKAAKEEALKLKDRDDERVRKATEKVLKRIKAKKSLEN